MPGKVQVTRLRISYIAARIHNDLQEIGEPDVFEQQLANPEQVRGLRVTLPFGHEFPVDTEFWSLITETALSTPVTGNIAYEFRRKGVPLRYRGDLSMIEDTGDVEQPRLEAHLHPFGVAVMATVDLISPKPATLGDELRQRVQKLGHAPTAMTVAGQETETTLGQTAAMAAVSLVRSLTDGQGAAWDISPHRLVTVISGAMANPPKAMPTKQSPLHLALHGLATDGKAFGVPDPDRAFVAQWDDEGYSWPPSSLVYMLKSGTSTLSAEADSKHIGGETRTADRHRLLLLQLAYITALRGLIYAAKKETLSYLPAWAKNAANSLGRLYGPMELYESWGLVPRSFMQRTDVSANIENILGKGLYAKQKYRVSEYG